MISHPAATRYGMGALVGLLLATSACGDEPATGSIGPDGGVISSPDGALTLVIWPGALSEWETFSIGRSDKPPPSFGPAYLVKPAVPLSVDAEIIYRGELPENPEEARIGAIVQADFAAQAGNWRPLELEPNGIDVETGVVRAHHGEIALYYALLDGEPMGGTDTDGMTTDSGDTSGTDTGDNGPPVSYTDDIQPLWTASCTTNAACHVSGNVGNLVDLSEGSYDRLVGVQSTMWPYQFVVPNSPADSLIFLKVDGPPANAGSAMPPAGSATPLTDEQIDTIRRWIAQGAPP